MKLKSINQHFIITAPDRFPENIQNNQNYETTN